MKKNERNAGRKPALSELERENLLKDVAGGMERKDLIQKYNVSDSTIKRELKKADNGNRKSINEDALRVWEHIEKAFDVTQIYVKALQVVPGGMTVVDRNGKTSMFYWDVQNQKVGEIPGETIGKGFLNKIGTKDLKVYGI